MEMRERILARAHEMFNKYGIRSVSMDDISVQMGISKKTLYQYFTDKESLVSEVIDLVLAENKDRCLYDRRKSENALHEVFLAFDMMQEMFARMNPVVIFDLEKYHPAVYGKFLEHRNGFLYQVIRGNLETGIREELYRADIDVDVLTRYRIESVFMAFNPAVFPDNRTNLLHIEQQIMDNFIHGIASPKAQRLIQKYKNQRLRKTV